MVFRKIDVELDLHNSGYLGRMAQSAAATAQFGREVANASATHKQLSREIGRTALVAGTVLATALGLGARAAIQFDSEMHNVAVISDEARTHFQATSAAVIDLTHTLPQSAAELAKGLYDIASSGFQGAEGLEILRQSAIGASAGLSTTAVAAKAIDAVLNAYRLSASAAADVNDILFQTVNVGVITFEELASQLGDVVGIAAQAGVSFSEVGSAIAAMTLVGIPAAEASTSLNRVITTLINPGDQLSRTMGSLGLSLGSLRDPAIGLEGVIDRLRVSTGGSVVELQKLFPEIRALRGVLALTSAEGSNYARVSDAITNAEKRHGAAQAALAEQSKSAAFQLKLARNEITDTGIVLTRTFLPVIKDVTGLVRSTAKTFQDLPGPLRDTVTVLGGLAAVTLLASGAFATLWPRIAAARAELALMAEEGLTTAGVLSVLSGASLGVLGVLGTLIGLTAIFSTHQKEAADHTLELVDAIKAQAKGQQDAVTNALAKAVVDEGVIDNLKTLGLSVVDYIGMLRGAPDATDRFRKSVEALYTATNPRLIDPTSGFGGQFIDPKMQKAIEALGISNQRYSVGAGNVVEAHIKIGGTTKQLATQFSSAQHQVDAMSDAETALAEATGKGALSTRDLTDAQTGLQKTLAGFLDPAKAWDEALRKIAESQKIVESGADVYADVVRTATEAANQAAEEQAKLANQQASDEAALWNRRHRHAIERQHAEKKTADDFRATVVVSLKTYETALRKQVSEQERWERDLATVARRAGPEVAGILRDMGKDGVTLVHQMATGTDAEVSSVGRSLRRLAPEAHVSLAAWEAELESQIAKQQKFWTNLETLARRGHVDVALALSQLGPEYADAADAAAKSSDKALDALSKTLAKQDALKQTSGAYGEAALKVLQYVAKHHGATLEQMEKDLNLTETDLKIVLGMVADELAKLPVEKTIHIRFVYEPPPPPPKFPTLGGNLAYERGQDVGGPKTTSSSSGTPSSPTPIPAPRPGLDYDLAYASLSTGSAAYTTRTTSSVAPAPVLIPQSKTTTQTIQIDRLETADPSTFADWADQRARLSNLAGG